MQRQRCVLRPLLVPNIEFTAHAVSAQTCWAELTLHSLHSSLLSSLLSIPPLLCHDPAGQPYWHSVVQNGQLCQVQAGSHTHVPTDAHWFYCLPMCVYYIAFLSRRFDNWDWKTHTHWINMNTRFTLVITSLTETDMIYWLRVGASNCYFWTTFAHKQPLVLLHTYIQQIHIPCV